MTDSEIQKFINENTGFDSKITASFDGFLALNFFKEQGSWIINKVKCKANGEKARDFATEEEFKKYLLRRCKSIKQRYRTR